jgi:hypothetical protein
MNIAFCISGHMRCFKDLEENFNIFKNYISNFGDIKIFISTWNKYNVTNCWSNFHNLSLPDSYNRYINKEEVVNHYKCEDISIFDQDYYNSKYSPFIIDNLTYTEYNYHPKFLSENKIINWMNMLYMIYECNILKNKYEFKNNTEFDVVFRIRPDFIFNNIYTNYINIDSITNKKLNATKQLPGTNGNYNILKDQFLFGSSKIMDIYSNSIYRVSKVFTDEIFGDPENVITKAIENFKIEINEIPDMGLLLSENPNVIQNRTR